MKRFVLLLLALCAPSACSAPAPTWVRTGTITPGTTISVRNRVGDIEAYAPAHGQPANQYTLAAYAPGDAAAAASVRVRPPLIAATSNVPGVRFLVRAPFGTSLDVSTQRGNINVADMDGIVNAHADHGDIKMLIPQYGNASTGTGNISVIYASATWPGTVRFIANHGNIELYVNEHAKARVYLHTDNGTVFSDFNLRGSSHGTAETIDSAINGGASRIVYATVHTGSIRLMQLKPQI